MRQRALLTEGNVYITLMRFSFPFLLANILQALYGASDLFMVGHFADSVGVAAVATGGQIMQTITGLSAGLTTGGTVLIGQHFGAQKHHEVVNTIKTILVVFAVLSILMTCATIFLLQPICQLMQVPVEAVEVTKQYLFICSCGILFIVGYNTISGILRGLGDSRTPLLLIGIACIINVLTDFLFVGLFRMGAPGAALSTVLAQAVSLILAVFYLSAKGFLKKYQQSNPHFRPQAVQRILSTGLPIAFQEGFVNISFLIITAIINEMGLIASASVGVVEKLIVFSMLPTAAFASAIAAMTAQHQGAGLMRRARHCLNGGIFLSLLFGLICFFSAQFQGPELIHLFSNDPLVMEAGADYLRSYSLDSIIVCFVFCMNAYFCGSGHPLFPLIHSLVATFLLRIPLSYFFSHTEHPSMFFIGLAAPTATLFSFILCQYYIKKISSSATDHQKPKRSWSL